MLHALANDVQLALERRVPVGGRARRRQRGPPADEHLLEHRLDRHRARANVPIVGWHVAPSDQALPFLVDDAFEERLNLVAGCFLAWEEHQSGAVAALGRQLHAELLRLGAEESVRHLNQDAGAVAGVDLAAAGAAVQQIDQELERVPNDRMRTLPLDVHDKPDATGVMLVVR